MKKPQNRQKLRQVDFPLRWMTHSFALLMSLSGGAALAKDSAHSSPRVIVIPQAPGSPLVTLDLIFRKGSVSDPLQASGLTQLTTRALLRGTKKKTAEELNFEIERLGAKLTVGVDTTLTHLHGVVLKKNLATYFKLLGELLTSPRFEERELEILKKTLLGEIDTTYENVRALGKQAVLNASLPMAAARPAFGRKSEVSKISREQVILRHQEVFAQDNLIAIVSGALNEAELRSAVKGLIRTLPSRTPHLPLGKLGSQESAAIQAPFKKADDRLPDPQLKGQRALIVPKEGLSTVPLYLVLRGIQDQSPDALALEVANFAFGADFTSKLMQELRNKTGWTYGAYSSFFHLVSPKPETGLFSIYTFPSTEFIQLAAPRTAELLLEFLTTGISESEFEMARNALARAAPFEMDTAEKRVGLAIRDALGGLPLESTLQRVKRLKALTHAQVQEALRKNLSVKGLLIALVGDPKILRPALEETSKKLPTPFESIEEVKIEP